MEQSDERSPWYKKLLKFRVEIWCLVISAFVLWALMISSEAQSALKKNQRDQAHLARVAALTAKRVAVTQNAQKEGRKASLGVTCATIGAVIDAGRATISGPSVPPPYERQLELFGFPPFKVRLKQSQAAAAQYAKKISTVVQQQTGITGVVNPDGTLNCAKLSVVAKVG